MSPTPLDLPVLIAQSPYVARLAHVENAKPEVQQLLFGPIINEHVRQNENKVQQVDKKEKAAPIDRDGHQHQQQAQPETGKRGDKHDEDPPETNASSASPWTGNIVNVKI